MMSEPLNSSKEVLAQMPVPAPYSTSRNSELKAIAELDLLDGRAFFKSPISTFKRLATWPMRPSEDRQQLKKIWQERDKAKVKYSDEVTSMNQSSPDDGGLLDWANLCKEAAQPVTDKYKQELAARHARKAAAFTT